jgi:putative phosphoesterase
MMKTIGVLSDTHIPDRSSTINYQITTTFQNVGVRLILHAGDVCSPEVLSLLGKIAPVHAVQGNRDSWHLSDLPLKLSLKIDQIKIGLIHGHFDKFGFFTQKLCFLSKTYQLYHYSNKLRKEFPTARIIIFGHTHRCENTWVDDTLLFNPGPSSTFMFGKPESSIGLIHIHPDKKISGEIIPLHP